MIEKKKLLSHNRSSITYKTPGNRIAVKEKANRGKDAHHSQPVGPPPLWRIPRLNRGGGWLDRASIFPLPLLPCSS